jgi:hypothetical protein
MQKESLKKMKQEYVTVLHDLCSFLIKAPDHAASFGAAQSSGSQLFIGIAALKL